MEVTNRKSEGRKRVGDNNTLTGPGHGKYTHGKVGRGNQNLSTHLNEKAGGTPQPKKKTKRTGSKSKEK